MKIEIPGTSPGVFIFECLLGLPFILAPGRLRERSSLNHAGKKYRVCFSAQNVRVVCCGFNRICPRVCKKIPPTGGIFFEADPETRNEEYSCEHESYDYRSFGAYRNK